MAEWRARPTPLHMRCPPRDQLRPRRSRPSARASPPATLPLSAQPARFASLRGNEARRLRVFWQRPGRRRGVATVAAVPATVVVGTQWGDEGKGKLTDLLAKEMMLVVRY